MKHRSGKTGDLVFDGIVHLLLIIIGIVTLYPFWNIFVLSFNNALDTIRGGVYLWPRDFTLLNFKTVMTIEALPVAFLNSVLRTVIGVITALLATSMVSYTISRKDFIFGKFLQRVFVITMYVSGGLIPYYFVIKNLGLRNNFLVYVIPVLISAYYLLIMRSFMDNLPDSIQESAKIDGANDFQIYYKIVLPLCSPMLAATGLFIAVDQWNSWFDSFIFAPKESLTTLQYELVKVLAQSTANVANIDEVRQKVANGTQMSTTPESIRMAITVVATLPIVLVYPFVQRYFVSGITLGAVKG